MLRAGRRPFDRLRAHQPAQPISIASAVGAGGRVVTGRVEVEVRRGGDVVVERAVTAAATPAERLDVDPQPGGEGDRVRDMPAVHPEPLLAGVEAVGPQNLVQAEVGRAVRGVALAGHVEVPGPTEVVLGAGAADRRELLVLVQVELHLALAPPATAVHPPRQVAPDVVAAAGHAVQQDVRPAGRHRVAPAPLGVQIAVAGRLAGLVGDLEVHPLRGVGSVLQTEPRPLAERHRPVAVEPAVRVDRDRDRGQLGERAPALAEEVTDRHLDRRLVRPVPVRPEDQPTPVRGVGGEPDVPDLPRSVDHGELGRLPRAHVDAGRHLPARTQVTGSVGARPHDGAGTATRAAVGILGADGSGHSGAQPPERAQIVDDSALRSVSRRSAPWPAPPPARR